MRPVWSNKVTSKTIKAAQRNFVSKNTKKVYQESSPRVTSVVPDRKIMSYINIKKFELLFKSQNNKDINKKCWYQN